MRKLIFLRSFGDFTIAIAVLKRAPELSGWKFFASDHLKPLYEDLQKLDKSLELPISFISFGIKHKILGLFTNRHFLSLDNFHEIKSLKSFIVGLETHSSIYLEQRRRIWLVRFLTGRKMDCVHKKGDIYTSYTSLFGREANELNFANTDRQINSILILPESRKKVKEINSSLIKVLAENLVAKGKKVSVGYFKNTPNDPALSGLSLVTHTSFLDLINLIKEADFIITADSLPAHLCQLLERPHFILYNKQPSMEWLTPFALKNNTYSSFANVNDALTYLSND
jgi:hypothetical protein